MRRLSIAVVCALGLSACSGDNGTNGSNGTNGTNGMNGMNGMDGMNGGTIIISDRAKHGLDISPVAVDTTGKTAAQIEAIGQGSYIVNAIGGCSDCHTSDPTKFLGGGTPFALDGASPPHMVYSRNLTPDPTHGLQLDEAQFIETLQTGKDRSAAGNEALVVMPWAGYRWMSTSDMKAIFAYLRAIPPVTTANMNDNKGPFAGPPVAMPTTYNEGDVALALPPETDFMNNPAPDPDHVIRGLVLQPLGPIGSASAVTESLIGRGAYIVTAIAQCNDCHTNPDRNYVPGANFLKINTAGYLAGGRVFAAPPGLDSVLHVERSMSADLLGANNGFFTNAQTDFFTFEAIITYGLHLDDANPMPLAWPMPWQHFRNMTLDDLQAVFTYVKAVGQVHPRTAANDKLTQDPAYYCAANADCDSTSGETCDTTAHECIGRTCTADHECPACDTCTGGHCAAPAASSTCLTAGIP